MQIHGITFRFLRGNAQGSTEWERYDIHISQEPFGHSASVNCFSKYVVMWRPLGHGVVTNEHSWALYCKINNVNAFQSEVPVDNIQQFSWYLMQNKIWKRSSQQCWWRLDSSGMLHCVTGQVVPGNVKHLATFIFMVKSHYCWSAWPRIHRYYDPLQCQSCILNGTV